jgi:hypothetical protein
MSLCTNSDTRFYSLISDISSIFEQYANSILVVVYICFISRSLSNSFFVLLCSVTEIVQVTVGLCVGQPWSKQSICVP